MPPSPQLGYNHNIPHRGRLYHVQTEDSGAERAHIFTHIFFDGTIIGSKKVKYDPNASVKQFDAYVIQLMQQSHKAMIRELRRGSFDEKIIAYIGKHPDPGQPLVGSAASDSTTSAADAAQTSAVPDADRPSPVSAGDPAVADVGPRTLDPALNGSDSPSAVEPAQAVDGPLGGQAANDPPAEQTLVDERVRAAARPDEDERSQEAATDDSESSAATGRSQPPAVPPRFAKAKRKRAAKGPPPPPRSPVAKGPQLRAVDASPEPDPSLQHPASPSGSSAPPVAPAASTGGGPRRLQRRRIGGIGGAGVSAGTKIETESRREVVVGKFASEHQHQLDEEILRLLGDDGSS